MEINRDELVGTEVAEVKAPKEPKAPSMTNIIVGVTAEHLAKFKGKSAIIAAHLAEGLSKSEVLKVMQEEEAANGIVEGTKPVSHQVIYQVYKRLSGMEGVTLGQKELVITRVKKATADNAEAETGAEPKVSMTGEFEAAAGEEVVEG